MLTTVDSLAGGSEVYAHSMETVAFLSGKVYFGGGREHTTSPGGYTGYAPTIGYANMDTLQVEFLYWLNVEDTTQGV